MAKKTRYAKKRSKYTRRRMCAGTDTINRIPGSKLTKSEITNILNIHKIMQSINSLRTALLKTEQELNKLI